MPSHRAPALSGLVGRIGASATLEVARRAQELRESGVDVVDLSAGQPDFPSPPEAVEAARRALADGFTRYTQNTGIPELREALAARYRRDYGAPWAADRVVVTVGGKAALLELTLALCDPGDEVVVPSPCWVTFPEQIKIAGGVPVAAPTRVGDGFRQLAEPVLDAIGPKTRGVILNSPSNPTGALMEAGELRRVVEACAERGLWVISDETYERFVFDGRRHASAASLAAEFPETVIVVSSFSKTYAMTGWRLGWAVGPQAVMGAVAALQSHATSNPTSFAMVGAVAALAADGDELERRIADYGERRDLVCARLDRLAGVRCPPPAGSFYAFPRVADCYDDGVRGSVAFAARLLDEARVAVVPGIAFGDDDYVRVSFAASRERLQEGLDRLEALLGVAPAPA